MIAVDWGGGSAALYSQAAANTRLVGLEVAKVIEVLVVSERIYTSNRFAEVNKEQLCTCVDANP